MCECTERSSSFVQGIRLYRLDVERLASKRLRSEMKLVLITQNEKMFLPKSIDYLLRRLDPSFEVVGAVVTDASPFGSKITFFKKIQKTLHTFGLTFVFRYGLTIIKSKLTGVDVLSVLERNQILSGKLLFIALRARDHSYKTAIW